MQHVFNIAAMKKASAIFILLLASSVSANACPFCNKKISSGIYDAAFYPNLFIMLSAFIVLAIIVTALTIKSTKRYKADVKAYPNRVILSPVPLATAATVIGIGMGGFIDGIVLHQILQVHEMLSNKIPATEYIGKSINMFWDGIFHAFCFIVVMIGIVLLWKLLMRQEVNRSGKLLSGGLLTGWALFNIVEGIIDHQLLKLHNVIELAHNHDVANYSFLGFSVIMLVVGYSLIRKSR